MQGITGRYYKVIYVSHPLAAETKEQMEQNRKDAAEWCAIIALLGEYAPIADWIILSSQWDESKRELGLEIDCAVIERCDELWMFGNRISNGMETEFKHAYKHGLKIKTFIGIPRSLESLKNALKEYK